MTPTPAERLLTPIPLSRIYPGSSTRASRIESRPVPFALRTSSRRRRRIALGLALLILLTTATVFLALR